MPDDNFNKQRAKLVRDLATKADPFIRRRLLDLAKRYERPQTVKLLPLPTIYGHDQSGDKTDGGLFCNQKLSIKDRAGDGHDATPAGLKAKEK